MIPQYRDKLRWLERLKYHPQMFYSLPAVYHEVHVYTHYSSVQRMALDNSLLKSHTKLSCTYTLKYAAFLHVMLP